ncbi:MAG TPA: hypothetical protein VMZ53_03945 [Kofleriaceae bacterium]|nr:hypothetical protein [Kofleriaceae bacterium]
MSGRCSFEVTERFVVRAAVGDERFAERGARIHIIAIFDDGLAQLANRFVEIAAMPPRETETAICVRQDRSVAASFRNRARQRHDRELERADLDERESMTDKRCWIAWTELERALERRHRSLRLLNGQPGFAEDDQCLPVVRLHREQRFERRYRRARVALREQLARLVQLVPVFIEDQLTGEVAEPALEP